MSKRLKNYPDPAHLIETYGADALRLYMIYSPVVRAENLRFSEHGVRQLARDLLIPWWNAYAFFVTYANVDGWHEPHVARPDSANELDRWIVSALETLVGEVTAAMDGYDLQRAVRPFVQFIDDLTNWYIRRSRRRFWKSQDDTDKRDAYRTLRYVLVQLCKVAAPFTPFISESIYRNLRSDDMPASVHLCDFPAADAAARDPALEARMARIQTVVRLGRQLRTEHDLKVRQPLARLHVASSNPEVLREIAAGEALVADELNIKQISYDANEHALAHLQFKADFRRLGPRVGPAMKQVAAAVARMGAGEAAAFAAGRSVNVDLGGGNAFALEAADVTVQRTPREGLVVAAEGEIVIAIETALTPALVEEGLAREFVSRVQNLRKSADFEVTQRIAIRFASDTDVTAAVAAHAETIAAETLALSCDAAPALGSGEAFDLNGHPCTIVLQPARPT